MKAQRDADERDVLAFLRQHPASKRSEIADRTGIGERAGRVLQRLRLKGLVTTCRNGSRWELQ